MKSSKQKVRLLWPLVFFGFLLQYKLASAEPGYPRTMAIAIGVPAKYDNPLIQKNLSKSDILILNFWSHWKENEKKHARDVVRAIKNYNPNILIGQYTILSEAKSSDSPDKTSQDIAKKLDKEQWWLKGPTGNRIQHTSEYGTWDINITKFSKPDNKNQRFPEWLAQRNYKLFFAKVPELDFWFLDIAVPRSPVPIADWTNDGIPIFSALPAYAKAYREGHLAYWKAIRTLQPQALLVGNAQDLSSEEYKGQLNGALLEAAMGKKWSIYERQGWNALRQKYYEFIADTRPPKLVGFNVWGRSDDYRKMRFGLTTCLLNDGYFSYTDEAKGYDGIVWFDEFDVKLGNPITPPPVTPLSDGVFRRDFENGVALVNPTDHAVTISLEKTYVKIRGHQDPVTNSGEAVTTLNLPAKDGIILLNPEAAPAMPKMKADNANNGSQ